MPEQNERDDLLRSLDRIRATASKLASELTELHNIVRFDHRSAGARQRVEILETELGQLTAALRQFRENVEREQTAP